MKTPALFKEYIWLVNTIHSAKRISFADINEQIILVPQRFSNTPSPKQLSQVAGGKPFQSPSCLLGCKRPENFCSVSWDKKVNSCSFAQGKVVMETLDYNGMLEALEKVEWKNCEYRLLFGH